MNKAKNVDEYLAGLPADQRAAIEKLREQIKQTAPEVAEVISWGVPMFKLNGKYIAGVAAYKKHVSFAPWGGWSQLISEQELSEIEHSPETIHFTSEKLLPDGLVSKLIQAQIAKNNELTSNKNS